MTTTIFNTCDAPDAAHPGFPCNHPFPTPDNIRPIPEEATNSRHGRKPGAVGIILDGTIIRDYVHSTLAEHECEDGAECGTVRATEFLLLASPDGEVAIIGHEGVGANRSAESDSFPVEEVAIGWYYDRMEIPAAVIRSALTNDGADVAGFIRLFGDRLDGNAYMWRRFVTGGTF